MRGFPRILCWLLTLLWVPVTMHCDMEALEGSGLEHASEQCDGASSCLSDGCHQVENGGYRLPAGTERLAAPEHDAGACMVCLNCTADAVDLTEISPPGGWDRPQPWVSRWIFDRRAARSPRAPSQLI